MVLAHNCLNKHVLSLGFRSPTIIFAFIFNHFNYFFFPFCAYSPLPFLVVVLMSWDCKREMPVACIGCIFKPPKACVCEAHAEVWLLSGQRPGYIRSKIVGHGCLCHFPCLDHYRYTSPCNFFSWKGQICNLQIFPVPVQRAWTRRWIFPWLDSVWRMVINRLLAWGPQAKGRLPFEDTLQDNDCLQMQCWRARVNVRYLAQRRWWKSFTLHIRRCQKQVELGLQMFSYCMRRAVKS